MNIDNFNIIDDAYGFTSIGHIQTREGIIFKNKNRNLNSNEQSTYIIKPLIEANEKKLFIYSIQKHLHENGFKIADRIILTKDNHIHIELEEKYYYCSIYTKGTQINPENLNDIKSASMTLAKMHNASTGFTQKKAAELMSCDKSIQDYEKYIKCDFGVLNQLLNHRTEELLRFKKQALKRTGIFDYEYSSIADEYYEIAKKAILDLNNSIYTTLCEKYKTEGSICHKDITSHNIITSNNGIYFSCFDNATIDLPLLDLYNLIKHRMKKGGWNANDAYEIINEYDKQKNITTDEIKIIKILFAFPQKLWRVVNKYYNSRKSWCEKSCILKLSEIKKEQKKIDEFLKTF